MEWIEVKATGPCEGKDEAAAILIESGSPGVVEKSDGSLEGYFPPPVKAGPIVLKDGLKKLGWTFKSSRYTDRNWAIEWKKYIKPVKAGAFFVKPTWSKVKNEKAKVTILIDPGMAFGTGAHPTTKNCLKAISFLILKNKAGAAFLDVGTGSGILAIGAKKLGAKKVVAIDNDPSALKVARENARINRVNVSFSGKLLSSVKGRYPVVAANIQSSTLLPLKKELAKKVKPGGFLILSGILKEEADEVKRAYLETGLEFFKALKMKEWATLVMKKKEPLRGE